MESPLDLVRRFCAAWPTTHAEDLAEFFTDDAIYHNMPIAPVTGKKDIAATISSFMAGVESIEFRVLNIVADGSVVLTERVDVFKLPDKSIELPVMGAFEVTDSKISAWRDYFDMSQFTNQMGS